MELFFANLLQFPTVVYTVLLGVMLVYWLIAALGTVDIDVLDVDIDVDADVGAVEGFAGLVFRLGLGGVPLTVVLTLIALTGWSVSYFSMLWLVNPLTSGFINLLLGIGVAIGAFLVSIPVTAQLIKPLRPLFRSVNGPSTRDLVGSIAVVRTSRVDQSFGEATLEDGGAGMILRVRADESLKLSRGDRVVVLSYIPESHAYQVTTEQELFN
ncbi:hypothetical protein ACFSJ3_01300 [Corallincola platygyrae]|uniref:Ubiquinone biosynthesis protein UbiH n=1 Tax=Corallincola platygyrae TaxID=1193278 RepID=A0ABW4XHR0_9GAMM